MKIQTDNPATVALHDSSCMDDDYRVEFNDDGEATVRESVGTALIERYPGIEAAAEGSSPSRSDDDSEDGNDDDSANGNDNDTTGSDN